MRRDVLICCGLVLMTAAAYLCGGISKANFVYFDDGGYVYFNGGEYVQQNRHVCAGLNRDTVAWAFAIGTDPEHQANWHPVTWLSHMLDVTMFGLWAPGHHLSSLVLHLANSVLVFLVLRRLTGAAWPSAAAAALFAFHPLHVESVAWVSERKDVLSTLFGLLAIAAYGAYARRPRAWRYALVLVCFALGLMAKPMLVTLPCVFLLLDYWPLKRGRGSGVKAPGLRPGVGGQGSGVRAQKYSSAGSSHERGGQDRAAGKNSTEPSLPKRRHRRTRRVNPPAKLAGMPGGWSWLVLEKIPFFALSAISSYVTFVVQRASAAWVGAEKFSLAERIENALLAYAGYLGKTLWPAGLAVLYPLRKEDIHPGPAMAAAALLLAISAAAGWAAWRGRRYLAVGWLWYVGMLVPVVGLVQVGAQKMADRYTYLPSLGLYVMAAWGAADLTARWPCRKPVLALLAAAVLLPCAWLTYRQTTYWANSESLFRHALAVTTGNVITQSNLGNVLTWQGRKEEAVREYLKAIDMVPGYAEAYNNLANTLRELGRTEAAIRRYRQALDFNPDYPEANDNLANTLVARGEFGEAAEHYEKAIQARPGYADAYAGLAYVFIAQGKTEEAVRSAQRACELTGRRDPGPLDILAVAYDQAGRFDDAAATAREAIQLAVSAGRDKLAAEIRGRLALYEAHRSNRSGGR